jgi:hypothetical protein
MGWRPESRSMSTPGRSDFSFCVTWLSAYAIEVVRIDVWASGAAITAISIAAMLAFSVWEEWFNLVLGLWSMVSPWALGFMHTMRCT